MKSVSILAILLLLTTLNINAQQAVSVSYNYGDIVVHSPSISNLVNGPVHGYKLIMRFLIKSKRIGENYTIFLIMA